MAADPTYSSGSFGVLSSRIGGDSGHGSEVGGMEANRTPQSPIDKLELGKTT
jgi:hypothetical protein